MNTKIWTIAIALVVIGAGYAAARPAGTGIWNSMMGQSGMMNSYGYGNSIWNSMMGPGGDMMNSYGQGNGVWNGMMGPGSGMMNSYGQGNGVRSGMMGYRSLGPGNGAGCGMGDFWYPGSDSSNPLSIEQAKEAVEQYLASTDTTDLKLAEVMEFSNHFYAEVEEKSTGIHAFELLINKYTGAITPEMGPNMMWNTKYGHMSWGTPAQASVTEEQAFEYAQEYLDRVMPGARAEDAEAFYGYYTIHVVTDGKISGMLSVNSYTGAVWYHTWHGTFIQMLEVE